MHNGMNERNGQKMNENQSENYESKVDNDTGLLHLHIMFPFFKSSCEFLVIHSIFLMGNRGLTN